MGFCGDSLIPANLASPGSWCAHQSSSAGLPIVPRDSLCRLAISPSGFLAARNYGYPRCPRAQIIVPYMLPSIHPTTKLRRSFLIDFAFTYSPQ